VDISEDDSAIFIEADMPGIKKEDVKVKLDDEVLTVSAERAQSEEDKKKDYRCMERSWGCLSRSFIVGENIDADKIEASYDNGVLKIKVPKIEPKATMGKEISIK
jgi:HSP20 family protein